YVARYTGDGGTYDRTVLVKKGTPSAHFASSGLFQDKINLAVDQTAGANSGNVYVAWSQYNGSAGNNTVLLARSTDHGLTFENPIHVTAKAHGTASFADVAVGPDGAVYVTFIDYPSSSDPSTGIWLVNSTDGVSWPTPAATIDSVAAGHQWFPDIASSRGTISVVFYDSRADPAYSADRPPGNTAGGANSGNVVNTYVAQSTNGGASWSETQVSSVGSNFGWETHASRRDGFWGDYLYISAVGGTVKAAWTDSRDLGARPDPLPRPRRGQSATSPALLDELAMRLHSRWPC